MKLGIVHGLTLILLLFSSLACVQGPMDLSFTEQQAFPQLSSSSPISSQVSIYDLALPQQFLISITNTSSEGFRTQWLLNGIVENASNNELFYNFNPTASNTGLGSHTLEAKIFSSDGTKTLGSRTWYVTVLSSIKLINRFPDANSTLALFYNDTVNNIRINGIPYAAGIPTPFAVQVNQSLFYNATMGASEALAYVRFFKRKCTDPVNSDCNPVAINIGDGLSPSVLGNATYRSIPTTEILDPTDDGIVEQQQVIAQLYRKDPAPSTSFQEIGEEIIWNITLYPRNQYPLISFENTQVSSLSMTTAQDSPYIFNVNVSDPETDSSALVTSYEFFNTTLGIWEAIPNTHSESKPYTTLGNNCSGTATQCPIIFPSYELIGVNPKPLTPQNYTIRVRTQDLAVNGSASKYSRYLIWEVATSEPNTPQRIETLSVTSANPHTENGEVTLSFTMSDDQYDDFCFKVLNTSDPLNPTAQRITEVNAVATAANTYQFCPADSYDLQASKNYTIKFRLPYTTTTIAASGMNFSYELQVQEKLNALIPPATIKRNFSLVVDNANPAPTPDAGQIPSLTTSDPDYDVVTGTSFSINPGQFLDLSAVDGIENKLYYRWQIATDAVNCTAATYHDIDNASTDAAPISLATTATAYPEMILNWTPSHAIAGQRTCFRLCYRDEAMADDCTTNMVWTRDTGGLVLARSNTVDHTAAITNMVKMASVTDTTAIPAITYHVVAESAAVGSYKIVSTTHHEKADSAHAILHALHVPAMATEIKDISIAQNPVSKELYVATMVNDGINANHNLIYVAIHESDGDFIKEFKLDNYARSMGNLMIDGSNWYLPYIETTDRQVVFATGTLGSAGAFYVDANKAADTAISNFGMTNAAIESILTSSAANPNVAYLMIKHDDQQSGLYSFNLSDTTFDHTDYTLIEDQLFDGNNIASGHFIQTLSNLHLDNDLYLIAINQSESGKLAMAKLDLDSPSTVVQNKKVLKVGDEVLEQVYPSSMNNLQAVEVSKKGINNHQELYLTLLNNSGILYMTKIDIADGSNDQWKLDVAKTSNQINPSGLTVTSGFFTASSLIENYALSTKSDGTDDDADTQFLFYTAVNGGTKVYSSLVPTKEVTITPMTESASGWHPGFFKTP